MCFYYYYFFFLDNWEIGMLNVKLRAITKKKKIISDVNCANKKEEKFNYSYFNSSYIHQ